MPPVPPDHDPASHSGHKPARRLSAYVLIVSIIALIAAGIFIYVQGRDKAHTQAPLETQR